MNAYAPPRCTRLSFMSKPPDYPVMVPYNELCELLQSVQRVKEYEAEVKRYREQVLALRITVQQCMEKVRELEKLL